MFKRVMAEMEKRGRLCPRADAQMREEKLGVLLKICICRLSSSGGGEAAYISQQQLNLAAVRFHKVQLNVACARAGRCQTCFLVPAGSCFLLWAVLAGVAGRRLALEWMELYLSVQEH